MSKLLDRNNKKNGIRLKETSALFSSPSKGLGDTIDKFTTATGIKKAVKAAASAMGVEDCGCDGRKDALNKAFPYK